MANKLKTDFEKEQTGSYIVVSETNFYLIFRMTTKATNMEVTQIVATKNLVMGFLVAQELNFVVAQTVLHCQVTL